MYASYSEKPDAVRRARDESRTNPKIRCYEGQARCIVTDQPVDASLYREVQYNRVNLYALTKHGVEYADQIAA